MGWMGRFFKRRKTSLYERLGEEAIDTGWGLDGTHFDRILEILVDALRHIRVSEEDIETAIRDLELLRNDVLVRGASVSETP